MKTVSEYVDEFIVDCKDMDPTRYENYTGQRPDLMLKNLQYLRKKPDQVLVRVPHIPHFNTKQDQAENAGILRSMGFSRLDIFEYRI